MPLDRLDPFVHMDQMGEVEYAPGAAKGTAWHPHRGFETVTYIMDGTFEHQDSAGGGGVITNGDTQWMTAGAGILHIERPPEALVASGGLFHGIQLWVNLPAADKWVAPRYQDIGRERVTLLASGDGGALVRVIAGRIGEHAGPGDTYTPITMVHATVAPGGRLDIPWDRAANALVYVLAGQGRIGPDGHPLRTGQLAVLGAGDSIALAADQTQESRAEPGRPDAGWSPHWRAGSPLRSLRHEHPGRTGPGLRGFPEGPHGEHPGSPRGRLARTRANWKGCP